MFKATFTSCCHNSTVNMILSFLILNIVIVITLKLYSKLTCGICKYSGHLVGKVVIITGANAGIGFETAMDLAQRGAKVLMACRNENLAINACRRIIEYTGNQHVYYRHLDLASFKSVREFALHIIETEKRLDILINNAGAYRVERMKTEDGMLLTMQTNHLGPFLLTNLLLPLLKNTAPSRIINVSSYLHVHGTVDVDDLNMNKVDDKQYTAFKAYSNTKLCNVLMTTELCKRLQGTGVTVNCLHPGVVATEIMTDSNFLYNLVLKVLRKFSKTPWEGAQTSIYLAVSPDIEDISGNYFSDCKESRFSNLAADCELARRLWKKSEELVELN